jgi:hypothetical protein
MTEAPETTGCPIIEGLMGVRLVAEDEDHPAIDTAIAEIERLRAALKWIAGPEPDALASHPVGGRSPEKANDARAAKAKEALSYAG